MTPNAITIQVDINAPIEKVWEFWTKPEHIVNWAFAANDWEAPEAENDLKAGGSFKTVMAAKDKTAQFDFAGVYTSVTEHEFIAYVMSDKREVETRFTHTPSGVQIVQVFDPESENSAELQRAGWQAILDNFKNYVEKTS